MNAAATRRGKDPPRPLGNKPDVDYWSGRAAIILVPLDGSIEAKIALPVAKLISRLTGSAVYVVHAADIALTPAEMLDRLNLSREEARNVVIELLSGPAPSAVVREAKEKDVRAIVMTTRGHTAYQGRTLRPVGEAVLRDAPCPVIMVRPEIQEKVESMRSLRRILLPIDGAPSTMAVTGPALDLAERSGAQVDVIYVGEARAKRPTEPGTIEAPLYVDQPHHEWPAWAREFLARLSRVRKEALTVPLRLFVRSGRPAEEILRFATDTGTDLIVLEWRGKFDPAHAYVVRRVLEDAPCPVLLLRTSPTA